MMKKEIKIEHCDEPNCPECNIKAYNRGVQDTIERIEKEVEEIVKHNDLINMKTYLYTEQVLQLLYNKKENE